MAIHRSDYPENWRELARQAKEAAEWKCVGCGVVHGDPKPQSHLVDLAL